MNKESNNQSLVSIIMNCYNGESYLSQSIESILSQTYQNWELIFWDNKSNDRSKEIFCKFNDKRFKYFNSPKHTKLGEARNNAFKKCKGKFISFLDVDDWWDKNKLYYQMEILNAGNDIKFAFSNYWFVDQRYNERNEYTKHYKNKSYSGFITNNLLKRYVVGISTVIFEKEILTNLTEPFDSNINFCDFGLFMNLSLKYKFFYDEKPLVYYRWHKENGTHKQYNIYVEEMNKWLKDEKNIQNFKKFENMKFLKINIDYINCLLLLKNKKKYEYFKKMIQLKWSFKKIKLFIYLFIPIKLVIKLTKA